MSSTILSRRQLSAVALSLAALLLPAAASPAQAHHLAPDTAITAWDRIGNEAFTAAALTPADGQVLFGYTSIAAYDSVMAISGRYEPFAVRARAPRGTSAEAAVAAAEHLVLSHYLPAQAATVLDPAYAAYLAGLPAGRGKERGVALGEKVAGQLIAARADDGFRAPATYTPPFPPVPGVWLPTAPTAAVGAYLPAMRPFALASADQFRPAGPPALDSARWVVDYDEVKDIGSATSSTRTAAQTLAAKFWAEPPVQQTHAAFRLFIAQHQLDVVQAARFMAMAGVSYADADIACYEAKYHFAAWRPITAIRAGDTDGNPMTSPEPAWTPLLSTPNHPEYPSAHSCLTPISGYVIARFLDTQAIRYTVPSLTGLGDRYYATAADLTAEVTNARVWGGLHFRFSVEDGLAVAQRTADYVLARHFRPTHCD